MGKHQNYGDQNWDIVESFGKFGIKYLNAYYFRSGGFHLPADPTTPTILIGAGSGIAPFRSFWQQHFHDMKNAGTPRFTPEQPAIWNITILILKIINTCWTVIAGLEKSSMMLVFGCRSAETDHLYKEETFGMKENGTLKNITAAYSRQPGYPKVCHELLNFIFSILIYCLTIWNIVKHSDHNLALFHLL